MDSDWLRSLKAGIKNVAVKLSEVIQESDLKKVEEKQATVAACAILLEGFSAMIPDFFAPAPHPEQPHPPPQHAGRGTGGARVGAPLVIGPDNATYEKHEGELADAAAAEKAPEIYRMTRKMGGPLPPEPDVEE